MWRLLPGDADVDRRGDNLRARALRRAQEAGAGAASSDGDVVRASVERFGTAYMSLEARLTENMPIDGPTYADRFHFKFMHAANGRGLEFDPILVHAHFTQHVQVHRRGPGKVIFKPSHHDPLGEIEVVELRGATYFEGDIHAEAQRLATVDAARFMPFAFQNIDDYTAIE